MRMSTAWFNILLACLLLPWGLDLRAAEASEGAPPQEKRTRKSKKPKPVKHVRVYVETRHDIAERSLAATVGKSNPMAFQVEKLPILNEVHVEQAALIEEAGTYQVQLRFNSLGSRVLEAYSAGAVGRHFVIMTQIDEEARWIAAPLIRRRLGDGVLRFVPDASREDMQRLVNGLNGEIAKKKKRWLEN